jgi:hypothetical protein
MKIVKLSQLDFDLDFNASRLPEMFEFLRISKISILKVILCRAAELSWSAKKTWLSSFC